MERVSSTAMCFSSAGCRRSSRTDVTYGMALIIDRVYGTPVIHHGGDMIRSQTPVAQYWRRCCHSDERRSRFWPTLRDRHPTQVA